MLWLFINNIVKEKVVLILGEKMMIVGFFFFIIWVFFSKYLFDIFGECNFVVIVYLVSYL